MNQEEYYKSLANLQLHYLDACEPINTKIDELKTEYDETLILYNQSKKTVEEMLSKYRSMLETKYKMVEYYDTLIQCKSEMEALYNEKKNKCSHPDQYIKRDNSLKFQPCFRCAICNHTFKTI